MHAATYSEIGKARDVLRVQDVERPEPGPGEVRVRVRVSGVNPTDTKTRDGTTARPFPADAGGFRIPHQDGVGEIDAVGDGVDPARVGQRVWLYLASPGGDGGAPVAEWGTAAQWCVVPEHQAVPVPEAASDDLGASLGVPALTAYHCLHTEGSLAGPSIIPGGGSPAGRHVLVAGGAGAVGHFAIELASWAGATVVSTVSGPEKAELARRAGADLVVDYHDADVADQVRTVAPHIDRFVEVAIGENLDLDLDLAGPGASIVSYAAGAKEPTLPVRACMTKNVTLRFVLLYGVPSEVLREAAREVTVALSEGALSELPVHRFALDDIAAAHEAVESGVTGKVLVDLP